MNTILENELRRKMEGQKFYNTIKIKFLKLVAYPNDKPIPSDLSQLILQENQAQVPVPLLAINCLKNL